MPYPGLPRATIDFLAGLDANNSRDWFEAHRAAYARDWLGAGLDLVAALSASVAGLGLMAVPKLNASLRRIHRDVRFSKDKRPYDPRLHLILSSGPAFNKVPGVHLVIGPRGFGYGAGVYGLGPETLDRYRGLICQPDHRAAFQDLLTTAAAVGCTIDPPELTRPPKGYAAADWDALIRRKSVIVRNQGTLPLPDWLFTPDALGELTAIARALAPLIQWLAKL